MVLSSTRHTVRSTIVHTNIDTLVFRVAGIMILISLLLAWLHSGWWLWFTAFVGANMLQASFSGFCPMATLLARLGVPAGTAFSCAPKK
jgi:hypothetical protein